MAQARDDDRNRTTGATGDAAESSDASGAEQAAGDRTASDEEIRRRAYELYQSRGGTGGSDMEDWLAAERELRNERGERGEGDQRGQRTGAGSASAMGDEPGQQEPRTSTPRLRQPRTRTSLSQGEPPREGDAETPSRSSGRTTRGRRGRADQGE